MKEKTHIQNKVGLLENEGKKMQKHWYFFQATGNLPAMDQRFVSSKLYMSKP